MLKFIAPLCATQDVKFYILANIFTVDLPSPSVVVVSGSVNFFARLRPRLKVHDQVCWILQQDFRTLSYRAWRNNLNVGSKYCLRWGLSPILFRHQDYGGATNACHLFGFSSSFGLDPSTFVHPINVNRSINHFWKPTDSGPVKFCGVIAPVAGCPRRPIITKGFLRCEGLLPVHVHSPFLEVCGPSVFHPDKLIRRRLSKDEHLALFDVPSVLCPVFHALGNWSVTDALVFKAAPSPVIITTLLRQLWGNSGGVELSFEDPDSASGSANQDPTVDPFPKPTLTPTSAPTPEPTHEESSIGSSTSSSDTIPSLTARSISSGSEAASTGSCISSLDTIPSLVARSVSTASNSKSSLTYKSFDTESEGDSFMPRRRRHTPPCKSQIEGWEFLDDVSIEGVTTLETEDATESVSTFRAENSSVSWSMGSEDDLSVSTASDGSVASANTLFTFSTNASESLFKPTAAKTLLETIADSTIGKKAVKADDAAVPVHLWNDRINTPTGAESTQGCLEGCRELELRVFRRALYLDCLDYLQDTYGEHWQTLEQKKGRYRLTKLGKDMEAVRNILWHASETSFFEYHAGSRLHFFRWPDRYKKMARDGVPVMFERPGPSKKQRQPEFNDPAVKEQVRSKIMKVIKRRYMVRARTSFDIKSLIKYFAVPKGLSDIRIVYDATASGLNEVVWAPSFWLATIDSLVRALDSKSWMVDRDIGDMFLNFQLHESAWCYAGVDIKPIMTKEEVSRKKARWYHWVRNAMGFAPSPYNSIKMALVAEEVIRGDKDDPLNPFHWKKVRLNLPGSETYDPTISWICKVRGDGLVACELFTFVDDERVTGPTEELTWMAAHTMAAKQAYLGIQDAARKADRCSQQPRAWAGAVVHVVESKGVCVLTSDEKWQKMKSILHKWSNHVDKGETHLNHKELLSDRGFLVYVTRAYPSLIPYVKGFHLTAEMWRGNRDEEGWKMPPEKCSDALLGEDGADVIERDEDEAAARYALRKRFGPAPLHAPPDGVTPLAPRLKDDLKALLCMTQSVAPPLRVVRPSKILHVFYGFGDASGKGRGSTFQGFHTIHSPGSLSGPSGELIYRVGVWSTTDEAESSNYRELTNLVQDLESEAAKGGLTDTEVYLFTDNSTSESAFYKGSSSSKKLHALVVRLHKLALDYSVILHVIHVAGTRMIAQGTDGCSRGVLMEGVMAGQNKLSFIDLDKSAIHRSKDLLGWIRSWCGVRDIVPLSPEGWFEEGHGIIGGHKDKHGVWMPDHEPGGKTHLWAPPPAVADAVLEELLKARHKRTDTCHVIVIPRLMAPRWRRLFHKVVDLSFVVDANVSFWPSNMFEPLFVGIVFPFIRHRPWSLKRAPLMVEVGRELRQMFKEGDVVGGRVLRKLFKLTKRLDTVPASVALGLLHMSIGEKRFPLVIVKDDDGAIWEGQEERSARLNTGVAGVHSVLSFQCEVCWIRNLEGRDLNPVNDRNYVACIRRANLDAINGRASRTIKNHIDHIKATEERCRDLNRTPNFPQRGPFPLTDPVGMGCAVDMLYRS